MRVKAQVRRVHRLARVAVIVGLWLEPAASHGGITSVLQDPRFSRLGLAPIAPTLANTVASTYPIASASSGVTYVYDPSVDTLVRQSGVAGPIFGERAETIGKGVFDLSVSFSYEHLTSINGDSLDNLVNRPRVNGQTLTFPVPNGITLADGRFTTFLPVHVNADLDVTAYIVSPSITYGLTPDLDVNVTLPLLRTSLGVTTHSQVPDPRFPKFALPPGVQFPISVSSASDAAFGVGDLLLRAKYALLRSDYVDVAAGLGLSLPTGSQDNLAGRGTTEVQPTLIFSHVFAGRFEPLLNVGADYNADDVNRSVVRWAVGCTYQALDRLSLSVVFLGRNELAAQSDPIPTPFFFQIERNDIYDASVGMRWRFADSGFIGVNALVPLNSDGFRPDAIPTIEASYAF
jgi:outer membrane putative beta-barrel porin/alpha-amylase